MHSSVHSQRYVMIKLLFLWHLAAVATGATLFPFLVVQLFLVCVNLWYTGETYSLFPLQFFVSYLLYFTLPLCCDRVSGLFLCVFPLSLCSRKTEVLCHFVSFCTYCTYISLSVYLCLGTEYYSLCSWKTECLFIARRL